MKFSAITATLVLATSAFAIPSGYGSSDSQSNKLTQVQKISVEQHSGDVKLWIDDSWVYLGTINTGNTALISADQTASQKNSKRGDDNEDQSNSLKQIQDISVDQKSGDVSLKIDDSWVNIGVISTGNLALIDADQTATQRNSKRGYHHDDDDQTNKATQVQSIHVDQKSGDVSLKIKDSWVKIGVISTGNVALIDADQTATQKNSKRGYHDDNDQTNKAKQVQAIHVNQKSGDVSLKIDKSWVKIGVISTGNVALIDADQTATQKNSKRGYYDDNEDQSNSLKQVQDISVDQKSGDVSLKIDKSWVKIGVITTGNFAAVDADQTATQKNS